MRFHEKRYHFKSLIIFKLCILPRSRECSGQQADTAFSRNFMSDQVQQCFNLNRDSMELGTFGYDMDGNANMASVLQVKKYYFYTYTTLMQNQLILTLLIYNF